MSKSCEFWTFILFIAFENSTFTFCLIIFGLKQSLKLASNINKSKQFSYFLLLSKNRWITIIYDAAEYNECLINHVKASFNPFEKSWSIKNKSGNRCCTALGLQNCAPSMSLPMSLPDCWSIKWLLTVSEAPGVPICCFLCSLLCSFVSSSCNFHVFFWRCTAI